MTDENVKEILACIIKHIRPDGDFYSFTRDEVEKMKKLLGSDDNKKEREIKPTNNGCGFDEMSDYSLYLNG